MEKKLSLGVIGHVDHGKTSLVKALTGVDTDRLKEEKERGLSIELGFSFLKIKNQGVIDLIDTPGHENFIRTMVSGATGIGGIILIIAANEGIQKQTQEHFDIANLLGIKIGLIVITKSDLVPEKSRQFLQKEIEEFTKSSFLQSAPIVFISSKTREGFDNLKHELGMLLSNYKPKPVGDYFYLPIDRVFTIKGFGTVITGTLRNGVIRIGDEIEILPYGLNSQVRRIEAHNEEVDIAYPGQRVAVNLRNINKEQIERGCCLASRKYLPPTNSILVELTLLGKLERIPNKNEPIKLLFGTSEVVAKYKVLDKSNLKEGRTCIVLFKTKGEIATPIDNFFIVRTCSPISTIGGGRIIDNSPKLSTNINISAAETLEKSSHSIYKKIKYAGSAGVTCEQLAKSTEIPLAKLNQIISLLPIIIIDDVLLFTKIQMEELQQLLYESVERFHQTYPEEIGITIENLKKKLPSELEPRVFKYLLQLGVENQVIRYEANRLALYKYDPLKQLDEEQKEIFYEIEDIFKKGRFKTAELKDVVGVNDSKNKLYKLLKGIGKLVELKNKDIGRPIVFHKETIEESIEILNDLYPTPRPFTISDVRKNLNTSRKYAVPLLEYLDAKKVTIREGDYRKLLNLNS